MRPLRDDDQGVGAAKLAARARARQARGALTPAQRARASTQIAVHLDRLRTAEGAHRIGIYAAIGHEVDLDEIAAAWLAAGLVVAYPRVEGPHTLGFHRVAAVPDSPRGPFGIREPQPTEPRIEDLDMVVTPGLAFDVRGGRVGYGRGFYDRYLAADRGGAGRLVSVGVCFAAQLVASVPRGPHDVDLDAVVTEDGVYR
ncbi:MAG TPA: 5-formyltetrahydrofolate cyclo-ligase [Euzebya sp.]|nr:5-formyltetrahydrofolate cyclo-ligase [Euzebya sp.]